jgi:hypothetical protein
MEEVIDFSMIEDRVHKVSRMSFLMEEVIDFSMIEDRVHKVSRMSFLMEVFGMYFLTGEGWDVCIPFHVFVTCVFSMAISLGTLGDILYTRMEYFLDGLMNEL